MDNNYIPLTVESVGNHIYFYSQVDSDRCLALIRELRQMDSFLRSEALSRGTDDPPPIWLHINSHGGEVHSAFAAADQIATIPTPIYSIVEGSAASAATILSVICKRRYITPHSFMLIHQISTMAWGTYEDMKDMMGLLDHTMDSLGRLYADHSKLSIEQIRQMLQRDTWMTARQALDNGFVDEIFGG